MQAGQAQTVGLDHAPQAPELLGAVGPVCELPGDVHAQAVDPGGLEEVQILGGDFVPAQLVHQLGTAGGWGRV